VLEPAPPTPPVPEELAELPPVDAAPLPLVPFEALDVAEPTLSAVADDDEGSDDEVESEDEVASGACSAQPVTNSSARTRRHVCIERIGCTKLDEVQEIGRSGPRS